MRERANENNAVQHTHPDKRIIDQCVDSAILDHSPGIPRGLQVRLAIERW